MLLIYYHIIYSIPFIIFICYYFYLFISFIFYYHYILKFITLKRREKIIKAKGDTRERRGPPPAAPSVPLPVRLHPEVVAVAGGNDRLLADVLDPLEGDEGHLGPGVVLCQAATPILVETEATHALGDVAVSSPSPAATLAVASVAWVRVMVVVVAIPVGLVVDVLEVVVVERLASGRTLAAVAVALLAVGRGASRIVVAAGRGGKSW